MTDVATSPGTPETENGGGTWSPLLDALGRHRLVVVGYLVVLAGWLLMVLSSGFLMITEVFHEALGAGRQTEVTEDSSLIVRAGILTGFLLLQAVFLWGGGRVRLRKRRVQYRRMMLSLFIFAGFMGLLSYGFLLTFLELINRSNPGGVLEEYLGSFFWRMLMGTWLLWMAVGLAAVRSTSHHGALSRLVAVLLSGSWIEFTVALPVELATRPRTQDCPCASGSWLALLICVSVLLWAVGPALFLLYLREQRLSERDPRRSVRVLLAKSRSRGRRR